MRADELPDQRPSISRFAGPLTWLGGGHWRELGERHERSMHAVSGAVVALGAALAWVVAALALHSAVPTVPLWAVVALTLLFGLLVGAVTRAIAGGPDRGRGAVAGRAAVAVAVGVVVGELAAMVVFSGAIDQRLTERAARAADSAPAVTQASSSLQQARAARSALDTTVEQARAHLDQALVVARCEYHPTPGCPQTRITGIPGQGPETRSSNELLAEAQRELDSALAARDRQAPELDARVARDEQAVGQARRAVLAGAGQGLGARWVAMNDLTMSGPGALALRLLTVAFCVMLYLLPLILRSWRGETTHDRHATARAERERAELDADTAIAIKRAEVRRAAEIMWAEHQLTQTRLAIEAQAEIDREQQRRRIVEALEAPVHASSERTPEPALRTVEEDIYLPIEAEAEAASRAVAELPPGPPQTEVHDAEVTENLPVRSEAAEQVVEHYDERHVNDEERGTPLIPSIPDATKAAARWIRPLVPPFVARVIDNTTAPLRGARQVFEEVEEIAFSLKRTRKVTIDSQSSGGESPPQAPRSAAPESTEDAATGRSRVESSRGEGHHTTDYQQLQGPAGSEYPPLGYAPQRDLDSLSVGHNSARQGRHELAERQGPRELRPPEGPRELPPGT